MKTMELIEKKEAVKALDVYSMNKQLLAEANEAYSHNQKLVTISVNENQERKVQLRSEGIINEISVGTFYSHFLHILRVQGYTQKILDTVHNKHSILKKISIELECDIDPEVIASKISVWKNGMIPYDEIMPEDIKEQHMKKCYELYEQWLFENHIMDMDDVVNNAMELLEYKEDERLVIKTKFRAFMAEEIPGSNHELLTEWDEFFNDDLKKYCSYHYLHELSLHYPSL